jgi:hypothetical protein
MANGKGWKVTAVASLGLSAILVTLIIIVYKWSSTTMIVFVRHGERNGLGPAKSR